jgi:23S rRNA pseudouridine1911/1915/1917 synthase
MSEVPNVSVSSNGFEYGVKHFYSRKAGLLTELLFSALNLAEAEVENLLKLGAIYVNNQRQTSNIKVAENLLCRVHTKPRRYNCDINWSERIIYENQDFLILNKPSGIPSHPSVDNVIENSLSQLALAKKINLQITHRLDTLTSGLIVYSKNSEFVKNFNTQIQNRNVDKKYVALVENSQNFPHRVIHYMEPSPRAPKKILSTFTEGWAECELEILEQRKQGLHSWVKINLLTGRTHQIRAQLSHLGSPIVGDKLYGSKDAFTENAIALRACELQFNWESQRLVINLSEDFDF